MNKQHHEIKCETQYFQEVEKGNKTFAVIKNDRDYKVYDQVVLIETVNGVPIGRESKQYTISYVTDFPDGIKEGYVVFSLADYVKL